MSESKEQRALKRIVFALSLRDKRLLEEDIELLCSYHNIQENLVVDLRKSGSLRDVAQPPKKYIAQWESTGDEASGTLAEICLKLKKPYSTIASHISKKGYYSFVDESGIVEQIVIVRKVSEPGE